MVRHFSMGCYGRCRHCRIFRRSRPRPEGCEARLNSAKDYRPNSAASSVALALVLDGDDQKTRVNHGVSTFIGIVLAPGP